MTEHWIQMHTVNCALCGVLFDEREAMESPDVEGEICPRCGENFTNCDWCGKMRMNEKMDLGVGPDELNICIGCAMEGKYKKDER